MANTYELISSVTVGAGGASSIDFTSIPATYTDLCVKASLRQDVAYANASIRFNSDSGSNYSTRLVRGDGSATASSTQSGTSADLFPIANRSTYTANTFANGEVYIPNYTAAVNKSFSADAVNENNATAADAALKAGLWSSTATISSITLLPDTGAKFVQYSTAYLYGIKNS